MSIIFRDVVLSYPAFYEPRAYTGGGQTNNKKYYQATILIPQGWNDAHDGMLAKAQAICGDILQQKLGDKLEALVAAGKVRWPFRSTKDPKQNTKNDGSPVADPERFSHWFRASSETQPGLVDRMPGEDGKPRRLEAFRPDKLYPGCIVNVSVNPAFVDYGTPGVSLFLNNVQHWADAPRLDNRVAPQDEFQADQSMGAVDLGAVEAATTVGADAGAMSSGVSGRRAPIQNLFSSD